MMSPPGVPSFFEHDVWRAVPPWRACLPVFSRSRTLPQLRRSLTSPSGTGDYRRGGLAFPCSRGAEHRHSHGASLVPSRSTAQLQSGHLSCAPRGYQNSVERKRVFLGAERVCERSDPRRDSLAPWTQFRLFNRSRLSKSPGFSFVVQIKTNILQTMKRKTVRVGRMSGRETRTAGRVIFNVRSLS